MYTTCMKYSSKGTNLLMMMMMMMMI